MLHNNTNKTEGKAFYFLAAPFIGLAYAVALPIVGIAAIAGMAGRKVVAGVVSLVGKGVSFGWRPAESYLSGKKGKKEKK